MGIFHFIAEINRQIFPLNQWWYLHHSPIPLEIFEKSKNVSNNYLVNCVIVTKDFIFKLQSDKPGNNLPSNKINVKLKVLLNISSLDKQIEMAQSADLINQLDNKIWTARG